MEKLQKDLKEAKNVFFWRLIVLIIAYGVVFGLCIYENKPPGNFSLLILITTSFDFLWTKIEYGLLKLKKEILEEWKTMN